MSAIDSQTSLGQLVAERPGRARVLEEFGLDYCCGGKDTLGAACESRGISVETVAASLKAADSAPAQEDTTDWTAASMTALCDHIEATHHAYLRKELPRITDLTHKVARAHGDNHPAVYVVRDTYARLRAELEAHMAKEEQILFPIIRQLDTAAGVPSFHCGSVANPIRVMEAEHEGAGQALATMSGATDGYTTPEDGCSTYRALMDALAELERDLHRHIHKENNILFPRAVAAEAQLAGK